MGLLKDSMPSLNRIFDNVMSVCGGFCRLLFATIEMYGSGATQVFTFSTFTSVHNRFLYFAEPFHREKCLLAFTHAIPQAAFMGWTQV